MASIESPDSGGPRKGCTVCRPAVQGLDALTIDSFARHENVMAVLPAVGTSRSVQWAAPSTPPCQRDRLYWKRRLSSSEPSSPAPSCQPMIRLKEPGRSQRTPALQEAVGCNGAGCWLARDLLLTARLSLARCLSAVGTDKLGKWDGSMTAPWLTPIFETRRWKKGWRRAV